MLVFISAMLTGLFLEDDVSWGTVITVAIASVILLVEIDANQARRT